MMSVSITRAGIDTYAMDGLEHHRTRRRFQWRWPSRIRSLVCRNPREWAPVALSGKDGRRFGI